MKNMPHIGVTSAGTRALVGRGADPVAVQLMGDRGLDISNHVSTLLTPSHVRNANLVLTMTRAQRELIETNYPYARGKTYRLGDHDDLDVVDPYQRGPFIFELAVTQIEQGVSRWLDTIARLSH
ncbi:low molecular weight phosphotyrosine protein phosphatase [Caballeronia sp. SBC1]|uniref:arsenate reductase/protein-tyrosine-phosphatase family protein n=1 Tax=Caballeronia sp. SBC1 TaxID=2705548 RepID=UPI001FB64326|nr:low molecular weight phosphotyrosine protein phosphatase [Caballeronia sp. SBC1]